MPTDFTSWSDALRIWFILGFCLSVSLTTTRASAAGCWASPKDCIDPVLCHFATTSVFIIRQGSELRWKSSAPKHVKEAKRRGLSCGIRPKWNINQPLLNAFKSLAQDDKILIQSNLKEKGFYKSSLDGLYGPGTQKALVAFGKAEFPELGLSQDGSAKELLIKIIARSEQTGAETQTAEPLVLDQPSVAPQPKIDTELASTALKDEPALAIKTAPPITSETVLERFNAGDFQTAMLAAQILAPTGDADAQFVLGRLYADGLGVLQQFKLGHMWLNLASLNGSLDAVEARNKLQVFMPPEAIVEAQEMAVNCIKTNYAACGLPTKPVVQNERIEKAAVNINQIRSAFRALPVLKRQQIQYALKDLGLYQSSIDASWGKGTSGAVSNYIGLKDVSFANAETVFSTLLSEVEVPNSFQVKPSVKKQAPVRSQVKSAAPKPAFRAPSGWQMFPNVSMAFQQADAICKPQSRNAKVGVTAPRMIGTTTHCSQFGNGFSCNSDLSGMQGFADMLEQNRAKKDSYNACMAQYGWKDNNKSGFIETLLGN
jgi:peptidoglycan hydrolase-like protein with peptidoglycan-binding domain